MMCNTLIACMQETALLVVVLGIIAATNAMTAILIAVRIPGRPGMRIGVTYFILACVFMSIAILPLPITAQGHGGIPRFVWMPLMGYVWWNMAFIAVITFFSRRPTA